MIVFSKHLLSPYYMSGTVLSATNSTFGLVRKGAGQGPPTTYRYMWTFAI